VANKKKGKSKSEPKKVRLSVTGDFQEVLSMPITKAQFDLTANPAGPQKEAAGATLWRELQEGVACDGTGYVGFVPGRIELQVDGKRHDAGTLKIDKAVLKQLDQRKPGPRKPKAGYFIVSLTVGRQTEELDIRGEFDLGKLKSGLVLEVLPDGSLAPMVSCSYDGRDFELGDGRSQSEIYLFSRVMGRVDPVFDEC